ncbi:MAG TPA: HD domain-containing protein [Candidatus Dormibacteraeota bacterium]|nr:HD domain-containing protein [Candidatus Dormibacteraeota bacterium]
MKPVFVSDLQPDQPVACPFLVSAKEILQTRDGKQYLRLELADRTGTIEARMWDGFEPAASTIDRDDFVKVQGHTELYRNRLQLKIDRLRKAQSSEIDPRDYFPHTPEDIEDLYRRLEEFASSIANPWLGQLARGIVTDPSIAPKLKQVPAAKAMHHAYRGGLLEHVISLCGLCRQVAAHYPGEIDADLLLTGAILHDIGKIEELEYVRETGYSTEGRLLGHILLGIGLIRRRIDSIEGFPVPLARLVEHLIASHHGREEFGSPRPPLFREALVLHYLDDLDSKMGAARASLDAPSGEPEWTERNLALGRQILRLDRYLNPASTEAKGSAPSATPSLFDPSPKTKS